jgi:hypothetical protein
MSAIFTQKLCNVLPRPGHDLEALIDSVEKQNHLGRMAARLSRWVDGAKGEDLRRQVIVLEREILGREIGDRFA